MTYVGVKLRLKNRTGLGCKFPEHVLLLANDSIDTLHKWSVDYAFGFLGNAGCALHRCHYPHMFLILKLFLLVLQLPSCLQEPILNLLPVTIPLALHISRVTRLALRMFYT